MTSDLRMRRGVLRAKRLAAFLTQDELAEKAGVSIARVKQIEAEAHIVTTPQTVRKLAVALMCAPSELAEVVEVTA